MVRELIEFVKRNPVKVVMLVLPLVTGGALAGLLKRLGVRLPAGLVGLMGGAGKKDGGGGGLEQAVNIARMFM